MYVGHLDTRLKWPLWPRLWELKIARGHVLTKINQHVKYKFSLINSCQDNERKPFGLPTDGRTDWQQNNIPPLPLGFIKSSLSFVSSSWLLSFVIVYIIVHDRKPSLKIPLWFHKITLKLQDTSYHKVVASISVSIFLRKRFSRLNDCHNMTEPANENEKKANKRYLKGVVTVTSDALVDRE